MDQEKVVNVKYWILSDPDQRCPQCGSKTQKLIAEVGGRRMELVERCTDTWQCKWIRSMKEND